MIRLTRAFCLTGNHSPDVGQQKGAGRPALARV
jgi:hypothetical protein